MQIEYSLSKKIEALKKVKFKGFEGKDVMFKIVQKTIFVLR